MYCTNCGSEIPNDATFCPYCAERVDRSTIPQTHSTQSSQPIQTPFEGTPITPSKSSGGKLVALIIVIIVGIILIYYGINLMNNTPTTGITLLVVGGIAILCIAGSLCGTGRGGGGGCDLSGCGDCGDCDCGC